MIGQSQPLPRRPAPEAPPGSASYRAGEAVESPPIERPISTDEVLRIASAGYPLWEPLEVMQLRNRRITVAYSDLSERLATVLTRGGDRRNATWCTFATWTSKVVGTWIEHDVAPAPLLELRSWPRPVVDAMAAVAKWLLQRENGASYRCLAAGNRFVFLEMGQALALFIERFGGVTEDPGEKGWSDYWREVQSVVSELRHLDPSWLHTEQPELGDLRLGLRQYYAALFEEDPKRRAEHILAGNVLLVAYEQTRLDGYVDASLALFTERAMRQLVRHGRGELRSHLHYWPSMAYARVMTKGLVLDLPNQRLYPARPLPPLPDSPLFPEDLDVITLPLLQALLTRWDLSDGQDDRRRAWNWADLNDRMSYIVNLFRSRQQYEPMFQPPFPADVERALLAGRLEPGPTEPVPSGAAVT
jgi:hypothetical protein